MTLLIASAIFALLVFSLKTAAEIVRMPKLRKLAYTVHVQARTEEAETLDFAVQLFEDEDRQKWSDKLLVAFGMTEDRRRFNNDRMMEEYKRVQAEAQELEAKAQKKG